MYEDVGEIADALSFVVHRNRRSAAGEGAQPGALDAARSHGYVVYLKARAEIAAARAAPSGTRPVLMGDDPVTQMKELFTAREPFYTTADATVLTEGKTPEQVAAEVVRLAQTGAGW